MKQAASPFNDIPVVKSWSLEKEDVLASSSEDIVRLPSELLGHIATILPSEKDLFAFELVFRRAILYTGSAWECLSKQEQLDIDWSLSDQDTKWNLQKARYLHGKVLIVYSIARAKLWTQAPNRQWIAPNSQEVQKLFQRFEGIMRHYPSSLGAFLWKDLNALHKVNSASDDLLFQRDFSIESSAGDLLLKGLSYLSEHILLNHNQKNDQQSQLRCDASACLKQAILKRATCASYLAIQILYPKYPDHYWYYYLTLASTDKSDYRGLELLLDKFPDTAELFYEQGISDPPVLAKIADTKLSFFNDFTQETEALFDKAIKGYKDHVPPLVYANAAIVKFKLNKVGEAEGYSTKAIVAYGDNVPASVYAYAAAAKLELSKLGEAEDYYTKAITACGDNVPASVYANAATAKCELSKFGEAEDYFTKAITAFGNNVPAVVYGNAALVKLKLNKLGEAEDYSTKAITACGDNVPASVYANAATAKCELSKFGEAEDYFTKAITTFGNNVPAVVYGNAALVKLKLNKLGEAEDYSTKAITAFGDNVPASVYVNAAAAKCELSKLGEAEDYYTKAITAYGDNVPADVYEGVAIVKFQLNELGKKE